ncbi:MAG: hypothetical protein JNL81_09740 [Hyphomonadaceae bacterium]|nr:hypothetical protein [Hyphomonadaceae bacterium]
MAAVASVGAAVSGWAALESIEETKNSQLLNRRIDACFEVDRRATAQLTPVLASIRALAGEQASVALRDGDVWEWHSAGSWYGEVEPAPCEPGEAAAACTARRARARELFNELAGISNSADAVRARIEFNASRTFNVIGPPALADAEADLVRALGALGTLEANGRSPLLDERIEIANEAIEAHSRFQAACLETLGEYRTR